MNVTLSYNGIAAIITTPDAELRTKAAEVKMLAELQIHEPIIVTIQHADSMTFDVPLSTITFDFQGTGEDQIKLATLRGRELNWQFAKTMSEQFPLMLEEDQSKYEYELLRLYLISDKRHNAGFRGTWNTYEPEAVFNTLWETRT